jgi:hypothetical protein
VRCIFCREDTAASCSIEHILPESLGNKLHVLPPGVVCDRCNNYFSHSVEKPFLDSPSIEHLRFHKGLEGKRGRIPSIKGFMFPHFPVTLFRDTRSEGLAVDVPEESIATLLSAKAGRLIMLLTAPMSSATVISRFVAKVALEALADRLSHRTEGIDCVVSETQLDALRDHARRGTISDWPVHIREIYSVDATIVNDKGIDEEILHEWDFLATDSNEWYFVLVLCGLEYTINMGGPTIEGYLHWLASHGQTSPLYSGKYANSSRPVG